MDSSGTSWTHLSQSTRAVLTVYQLWSQFFLRQCLRHRRILQIWTAGGTRTILPSTSWFHALGTFLMVSSPHQILLHEPLYQFTRCWHSIMGCVVLPTVLSWWTLFTTLRARPGEFRNMYPDGEQGSLVFNLRDSLSVSRSVSASLSVACPLSLLLRPCGQIFPIVSPPLQIKILVHLLPWRKPY